MEKSIVDQVIDAYGGISEAQERFGYTEPMGVYNWRFRGIPKSLIADIYIDTGIEVSILLTAAKENRRVRISQEAGDN